MKNMFSSEQLSFNLEYKDLTSQWWCKLSGYLFHMEAYFSLPILVSSHISYSIYFSKLNKQVGLLKDPHVSVNHTFSFDGSLFGKFEDEKNPNLILLLFQSSFVPLHEFPTSLDINNKFADTPCPEIPPPKDNNLKLLIEGVATLVARCGKLFEDLSREKNQSNPLLFMEVLGGVAEAQ
ncbi:G patch domain-containing protein TGH [Camellia lanceoleosa]|uniref:G patch domain-containing protein TGH n=1 Tax=Camellia lanceoleosa TaxID=1840588 RepID=A0ACC0HA24_9ERIC|nr:G patch domain-containing protein TGH [Camellia lanceoleosa]